MSGANAVRHSSKVDALMFIRTEAGLATFAKSSAVTGLNLLVPAWGDQTVSHIAAARKPVGELVTDDIAADLGDNSGILHLSSRAHWLGEHTRPRV